VNTSDVAGAWPHVGALANESVRIATYYTTMLCTPTRGAFMTGRLPQRLGLHHGVIGGFQDYGLPANETTIADKLKGAGYATAHVGKWHLGNFDDASEPTRRGFDESYAVWKPSLQPDFNVSVFECFDTSSSTGLRELDESDRSVQKSAESTSI
jgi:arylsulfatase A-like enzyme